MVVWATAAVLGAFAGGGFWAASFAPATTPARSEAGVGASSPSKVALIGMVTNLRRAQNELSFARREQESHQQTIAARVAAMSEAYRGMKRLRLEGSRGHLISQLEQLDADMATISAARDAASEELTWLEQIKGPRDISLDKAEC